MYFFLLNMVVFDCLQIPKTHIVSLVEIFNLYCRLLAFQFKLTKLICLLAVVNAYDDILKLGTAC